MELDAGEEAEPLIWEAYKRFLNFVSIGFDEKKGAISVEFYYPKVAFTWVKLLKQEINGFYQQQDMLEAQKILTI